MNVILLAKMLDKMMKILKMLVKMVMLGMTKQTNIFYNADVKAKRWQEVYDEFLKC